MKRSKVSKRLRAVKGGVAKLTKLTTHSEAQEMLTEQQSPVLPDHSGINNNGILRQDDTKVRLPNALADAGESETGGLMPSGLVLFIIGMALVFIAIVVWQVSQMPAER